jgi:hypothetical protein
MKDPRCTLITVYYPSRCPDGVENSAVSDALAVVNAFISRSFKILDVQETDTCIHYKVYGVHTIIREAYGNLERHMHGKICTIFGPDNRLQYKWLKRHARERDPAFKINKYDSRPKKYKAVVSALRQMGYDFGAHREGIDKLFGCLTEDVVNQYTLLINMLRIDLRFREIDTTISKFPRENTINDMCEIFAEQLNITKQLNSANS